MAFDVVTYILSKKYTASQIAAIQEAIKGGLKYQGSVATEAALPTATQDNKGHMYTTTDNGHEHVSDGTQWVDLSKDLEDKQDKLTPGTNITIDENNIISALDAQIGQNFTTNTTVGHLKSGTVISEDMTLKEILCSILYKEPTGNYFSQYKEADTAPTSIDSSWTQASISDEVKLTGLIFTVVGSINKGFLGLAYSKALGQVAHIYQNDMTYFDIIDSFNLSTVTYNGMEYYMYCFKEKAAIAAGDTFKLVWS